MTHLPMPRGRAARHVRRTAKFMDRHYPVWYGRINVGALDLSTWKGCILGQVYGASLGRMPVWMAWWIMLGRHLRAFNVVILPRPRPGRRGMPRGVRYCHDLDAAWRYEIDMRRRTDRMRGALAQGSVTDYAVTLVQ